MAVAALLSGVSAVEIKREPLLTWAPSAKAGGYPKDYFVPHFGEDHDISSTKKNVADAEKKYSHVLDTSGPPDPPPRDYFVPHFGEDTDIKLTKKNVADAEAKLGHVLDTSGPPDPPPRYYFVPHFGEDHEITYTKKNIKDAETALGHILDVSGPPDPPPRNYFVPHFGIDNDIVDSVNNLHAQEAKFGTWHIPMDAVQLDSKIEREPLLSWAPTPKEGAYPKDYFVPHFGEDHDIASTKSHEAKAAASLGHVWTPPRDYFVPHFGEDTDIK